MAGPWEKYQSGPWEKYQQPTITPQPGAWEDMWAGIKRGAAELADNWIHEGMLANPAAAELMAESDQAGIRANGAISESLHGGAGIASLADEPVTGWGKGAKWVPEVAAAIPGWEMTADTVLPQTLGKMAERATGQRLAGWVVDKAQRGILGGLGSDMTTGQAPSLGGSAGDAAANVFTEALFHVPLGLRYARELIGQGESAVADAAAHMGVTPTAGTLSSKKTLQTLENMLQHIPGAAGLIDAARRGEWEGLSRFVGEVKGDLGYQEGTGQLGDDIKQAIDQHIKDFKAENEKLYDNVFSKLHVKDKIKTANFGDALQSISTRYAEEPEMASVLGNKFVDQLAELYSGAKAKADDPEMQGILYSLTGRMQNGEMSTQVARALRQRISAAIGAPDAAFKGVEDADLSRLYGALSVDLDAHMVSLGGDVADAWRAANDHYAEGRALIDQALQSVNATKTGDAVYQQLFGNPSGALNLASTQKLQALFTALPEAERNRIAAEVVHRAGLEGAGAAGVAGRQFNPASFLTSWNKLAPEAKTLLFDAGHAKDLDAIATYSAALKDLAKTANHSNTANHMMMYAFWSGAMNPIRWPIMALTAAGGNLTAKLLTNPRFARWLVDASLAESGSAVREKAAALVAMYVNHPDMRSDITDFLRGASPEEQ
ncbi:hypothetical protein [Klebsiella michiganensis]|uniref:hypothetical protein n=1 Tax=Klebsiella michiganensis TaxID=1134687 RepID=UPI00255AB553|nr:hypothetical protein [Klebsiella michiganensis]MDL4446329.1 hypothetical protein [Klebsiella michiganensis]MDL4490875.1 hypothetical protein [Klebsiella michiganensis]MDL4659618.1 hypothetical protein [Klebsiella michiganensis]